MRVRHALIAPGSALPSRAFIGRGGVNLKSHIRFQMGQSQISDRLAASDVLQGGSSASACLRGDPRFPFVALALAPVTLRALLLLSLGFCFPAALRFLGGLAVLTLTLFRIA